MNKVNNNNNNKRNRDSFDNNHNHNHDNKNIKQVLLPYIPLPEYSNHFVSLLRNVDSVIVLNLNDIHINSTFLKSISCNDNSGSIISKSKLKTLKFRSVFGLIPDNIPNSIIDLTIEGSYSQITLQRYTLPCNIKKLVLKTGIEKFHDQCLPKSLNYICFEVLNPSLFTKIASSLLLLNSLVKLELLDHRLIIDNSIIFPNTLQVLNINCSSFNGVLPYNNCLKDLSLQMTYYEYQVRFPSSLENLRVGYTVNNLHNEIFQNPNSIPPNLKSLKLTCKSILDNNGHSILPNTIEKLIIAGSFNEILQANQLPSSLTHLEMDYSFNQVIDVNVLPESLKTIIFSSMYSQEINPLAIPQNLKLLKIENLEYQYPIKLTPSTHPYTAISCPYLKLYYKPSYTEIRVLRLPFDFDSPLSTLQLQDKSNLEYLYIGPEFNQEILQLDLPTQNNIITLELWCGHDFTINLEYFQNLETIILNFYTNNYVDHQIKIITTTINNNINSNNNNNINKIIYNNYKLKNLTVPPTYSRFIKELDSNFYQFIKLKKD